MRVSAGPRTRVQQGLRTQPLLRTVFVMTPIEAAILAAELLAHLDALSTLDLHPYTSAEEIELHRREALACSTMLSGYLVASPNFEGVTA